MPGDFTAIDSEMLEDVIIVFGPVNKGKLIRRGLHINPDNAFLLKEQRGYIKARGKRWGKWSNWKRRRRRRRKNTEKISLAMQRLSVKRLKRRRKRRRTITRMV
jgi:hypothetical protein